MDNFQEIIPTYESVKEQVRDQYLSAEGSLSKLNVWNYAGWGGSSDSPEANFELVHGLRSELEQHIAQGTITREDLEKFITENHDSQGAGLASTVLYTSATNFEDMAKATEIAFNEKGGFLAVTGEISGLSKMQGMYADLDYASDFREDAGRNMKAKHAENFGGKAGWMMEAETAIDFGGRSGEGMTAKLAKGFHDNAGGDIDKNQHPHYMHNGHAIFPMIVDEAIDFSDNAGKRLHAKVARKFTGHAGDGMYAEYAEDFREFSGVAMHAEKASGFTNYAGLDMKALEAKDFSQQAGYGMEVLKTEGMTPKGMIVYYAKHLDVENYPTVERMSDEDMEMFPRYFQDRDRIKVWINEQFGSEKKKEE